METVGFSVGSIGQLKELDEIGGENSFESKYLKNGTGLVVLGGTG